MLTRPAAAFALATALAGGAPHANASLSGEIHCTAQVRAPRVQCRPDTAVAIRVSGVRYDERTRELTFYVALQNRLATPAGTWDGQTTAGATVFFAADPTVTAWGPARGTGRIEVANADGRATFTAARQPYHRYPVRLPPGGWTPPKRWALRLPRGTRALAFTVRAFTATPGEPRVPIRAPEGFLISADSLAKLYAPERSVAAHPRMSGPYPATLIAVEFAPGATQDQRQVAVDAVNGRYVGGLAPFYYVQIAGDRSGRALWASIDLLRALPQVKTAVPDVTGNVRPG